MGPSKDIRKEVETIITKRNQKKPIHATRKHIIRILLIIAAVLLVSASVYGAFVYITRPCGRIASPEDGSLVSRVFEITGYTKNIPPSRKYIWIVVDAEEIGLCWPKRPINNLNGPFKTKIHEAGLNENFVVSLYAVDNKHHEKILKWFDQVRIAESEPGFPIIPEDFKLDSITLMLQGI